MDEIIDNISVFFSGVGLKLLISYMPPIAICWYYFVSYLRNTIKSDPQSFNGELTIGLVGIAITSAFVIWLIVSVVPPLRRMIESTRRLERGDLSAPIPYRNRPDEIGELARALNVFKETALEKADLQQRQTALQQEAERQRQRIGREMASAFMTSFSAIVEGLLGALGKQDLTVQSLRTTAAGAAHAVHDVSKASRQASANISAIAATSEELAASSSEIGRQAGFSRQVAEEAVNGAERTNQQVATLKAAAERIGDVVALISDIAGQTNLLALNATIEAARAGELGKGFAVVASEVKTLSNQTASATKEIANHIASIQTAIGEVVDNVGTVVTTIGRARDISSNIAEAVDQQVAATREIAQNVHTAVAGTASVDSGVTTMADLVARVSDAVATAADAFQRSQQECAHMQKEVSNFVARMG